MSRRTAITLAALPCLLAAGCSLQKAPPAAVLATQDFIADPVTSPTQRTTTDAVPATPTTTTAEAPTAAPLAPAAPRAARPPVISPLAASDGLYGLEAVPGEPDPDAAAIPLESPVLVDAKVGEINGRPVRADDVLGGGVGNRLRAIAQRRRFTREEWGALLGAEPPPGAENTTITRGQWMEFSRRLFREILNRRLEDQLLAEEARASLKPEQRQGLKYLVQEFAENQRRQAGGVRAAVERRLREEDRTVQSFTREQEQAILIEYQLQERLRKRIRTTWKDIRQYYERNIDFFNQPPTAHFRLIRVPADNQEAISKIQAALDAGIPFAEVASMPENTYGASEGGRMPPQRFTGEFAEAEFFSEQFTPHARALQPGRHTPQPFDVTFGNTPYKAWLFLESIHKPGGSLSDPEIQLRIAEVLDATALNELRRAYIGRLKERATFTDLEVMADRLAEIAADRYWPRE